MANNGDRERTQAANVLTQAMGERASSLVSADVRSLIDPTVRGIVRDVCARVGATEASVWWIDATGSALEIAYNSGPNAAQLIGKARQPLSRGIVSMVVASEQAHLENAPSERGGFSADIDQQFQQKTRALIAVPLYVWRRCGGVLSCVQLGDEPTKGFRADDLLLMQRHGRIVDDLLDLALMRSVLGGDP